MAPYKDFIDGSYTSQSPISDQEDTINWYLENMEADGATSKASLYPAPGFRQFCMVGSVGGRAMFALDRCFGIIGSKLYEFFADGTSIDRGDVAIDSNPATICTNGDGGDELFVTSGGLGYVYDLTLNTLTNIAGLTATIGGMLYGYFVAFDAVSSTIRLSDLFDGTTWDPTQFAQRTIGADPWTSMLVTPYGQIFLPGSQTGEFWYNAGTFPFPFAPDPSGLIEEGIAATFSVKQAGKSSCWLSTNKNGGYAVQRATGFTPQRISTHAVEYAISRYSRVDDAVAETYEDQGHAFFLLTFPTARVTWVYDFITGRWAKRGTWITESNQYTYSRPVFHAFAFNKHLMADRETGVIYEQDIEFPLDVDGRVMRRIRRAPALVNGNKRLFFPEFEIILETGIGTQTGAASNPQIMMRSSDNGGKTWGNYRQVSDGEVGQYEARAQWQRNGAARKRVFEVSVTDPLVNWRITDATVRIVQSTEPT